MYDSICPFWLANITELILAHFECSNYAHFWGKRKTLCYNGVKLDTGSLERV